MKRHTRIITAHGDDGQQYSLYIYTDAVHSRSHMTPSLSMEDNADLATSDGQLVRWRAKGVYEIVNTGVILRSAAQDAP